MPTGLPAGVSADGDANTDSPLSMGALGLVTFSGAYYRLGYRFSSNVMLLGHVRYCFN